jgi:dinuclear metal center YbgI/SA1388 family protein
MHLTTLISRIESTAPPYLAASWDKCGVQVAAATSEIRTMCVALDPDVRSVRQAVEEKADILLCHHPLSLSPRLPDRLDGFHEILRLSLTSDMWIYSAHTSLDANPDGPVNWLGRALALQGMRILEVSRRETPLLFRLPHAADRDKVRGLVPDMAPWGSGHGEYLIWPGQAQAFRDRLGPGSRCEEIPLSAPVRQYGFGCIGSLPQALAWAEFAARLNELLGPTPRMVGTRPERVATVAYCPGSGADMAPGAFAHGADVYLTGDLKYHQAQAVQNLGLTVDVGHFCLEETMMRVWSEELATELAPHGVRVVFLPGRDPFA